MKRQLVAQLQLRAAAVVQHYFVNCILVDSNNLVQVGCLDCDEGGHDFGCACHRHRALAVQVVEDMISIVVQ